MRAPTSEHEFTSIVTYQAFVSPSQQDTTLGLICPDVFRCRLRKTSTDDPIQRLLKRHRSHLDRASTARSEISHTHTIGKQHLPTHGPDVKQGFSIVYASLASQGSGTMSSEALPPCPLPPGLVHSEPIYWWSRPCFSDGDLCSTSLSYALLSTLLTNAVRWLAQTAQTAPTPS